MLHLLYCQGFEIPSYGFTLAVSDLQHPRLLQRLAKLLQHLNSTQLEF